jgi:hypothetical protein
MTLILLIPKSKAPLPMWRKAVDGNGAESPVEVEGTTIES